jgi:dTDP-glucose 4,6-dehydratase
LERRTVNLLVTGSAGFIGSHFVRIALGTTTIESVTSLDKLTYAGHPSNILKNRRHNFYEGDIVDRELVETLITKHKIDMIVHFAAESHVDRSIDSPREFIQTNILGTFELLERARKHHLSFLQVSTDEVFGSLDTGDPAFTETHPYKPNSPYAASKASADHLVRAYHHTYGLRTFITNCSNNFGPRQFPEKLIPLVILNALENKPIPIYGDGNNVRDWLFVEDHCTAILRTIRHGVSGESYCIGGQNEVSNLDLVHNICTILDEMAPSSQPHANLIAFVKDRPGHDQRYAINTQKINSLGWHPEKKFAENMRKTVSWYLENQKWCQEIKNYRRERLGLGKADP